MLASSYQLQLKRPLAFYYELLHCNYIKVIHYLKENK